MMTAFEISGLPSAPPIDAVMSVFPHTLDGLFGAAIVRGEDQEGVVRHPPGLQRIEYTAGRVVHRPVTQFRKGGIYQGGNRAAFEKALRVYGENILYVGDHIYGDIVRSKKSALWRTALVVEELEDEVRRSARLRHELNTLNALNTQCPRVVTKVVTTQPKS